jgi:hypothetical protein
MLDLFEKMIFWVGIRVACVEMHGPALARAVGKPLIALLV